jgi:hypothetical protein
MSTCHPHVIRALLAAGADPLLTRNSGTTALMSTYDPVGVTLLVEAGPEAVNMVDNQGDTALLRWSRSSRNDKKSPKAIRQLFAVSTRCGVSVDVNKRNIKGLSALDEALAATHSETVSLLMAHGATLNATTIIKPFQRVRRSKNSDANINACLRTVLQHALDTGCFEQPAVEENEEDEDEKDEDEVEDEDDDDDKTDDEETEEEEPAPKRRRRQ